MRIKFDTDDKLPFNKTIPIIAIVVRAVFHENNKYPQVFSDECLSNINRK